MPSHSHDVERDAGHTAGSSSRVASGTGSGQGFSLNALGRAILLKAGGLAASVQVIDAAAAPHHELDQTGLVLDLKSPDVKPESVRAFAELNLRFLLGAKAALADAPAALGASRHLRGLVERIDASITLLERDLQCPIKRGGAVLLEPMAPAAICQLSAMQGLPKMDDIPQIAALSLIIEGSGIGAAIQARRQLRHFGLDGTPNGGAEYLNSYGGPLGQIVRVTGALRQLNPLLATAQAQAPAQRAAVGIFEVLLREFQAKTAELGLSPTTEH